MKEIALKFKKGEQIIRNIDYFSHMLYPLMKDKKLIQKLYFDLERTCKIIIECVLLYEYKYKRISNFNLSIDLFKKVSKRFNIDGEEIKLIEEIINKANEIKNSQVDFLKKEKYVALRNKQYSLITIDEIKNSLEKIKKIYKKIKENFGKDLLISKYLK